MPEVRPRVWLDHFVVGIQDLDAGSAAFEALTGVRPTFGGEHPTLGTHNVLVSLGPPRYLEILAPVPGRPTDPMFSAVRECTTLKPVLWALATDDVASLHRLVTEAGFDADEPWPGARVTTEGDTLRWNMFMMNKTGLSNAPFFTEWARTTQHPSGTTPQGCSLEALSLRSPDQRELATLLDAIGFDADVTEGPPGLSITLDTPKGRVVLD